MSDEWAKTTLGKVARVQSGFPFSAKDWTDSGTPVIKIKNVRDGQVTTENCSFISEPIPDGAERFLLGRGDLLITLTGEIGAIGFVNDDEPMYLNQRVGKVEIIDGSKADLQYVGLFLSSSSVRTEMWSLGKGNAQLNISPSAIHNLGITLPPLPVQRRIVDLLTHLDAHIANLRTEREALDRVRTASLEMAMQGELPVVAMSDEWVDRSLEELVDILDSMRKPVSADERQRRLGEVPYYGATGQAGWIDDFLFDEPLVLLGEDAVDFSNPLAQKAYVVRGPSWVNNHAHVLRAKESLVETDFLCHSLNHLDYAPYASFGTRSKLTQAKMRGIAVRVPPLPVQRRIVDLIADIDAEIAALDVEIASLKVARTSMLSSLLDASVAIPKPYDDLLERAS